MEALNKILANMIDMAMITKQAHWNMKGTGFIGVHELLDECTDNLRDAYDLIAEFIASRDQIALGTSDYVNVSSVLPSYPTDIIDVKDHVEQLSAHYRLLIGFIESVVPDLNNDTEQNFIQDIIQDLRKMHWKVRSNLPYTGNKDTNDLD